MQLWKYVNFILYLQWKRENRVAMSPAEAYVWQQIDGDARTTKSPTFAWLEFPTKVGSRARMCTQSCAVECDAT